MPTIVPALKAELVQRTVLRDTRDEKITQSVYAIGVGRTLATENLEPGDSLPDNSDAEILESRLQKIANSAKEQAIVVARESKAWGDDTGGSDTAVELFHSRVEEATPLRHHFIIVFEVPTDSLSMSGDFWGAADLPEFGDDYPYGVWTGLVTPTAGQIEADPRAYTKTARVIVHYFAPRSK